MEDRKLNSQESLDLIASMIRNTQNTIQKNAGSYSVLWGYITFLTALAVYFCVYYTGDYRWNYMWAAIPVIGMPIMLISDRNHEKPVRTFVDTAVNKQWIPVGISLCIFPFFIGRTALTMVTLLFSIAMMQTGLVVKYRVFTIAGAIGIAGALALIFIRGLDQILVFAFLDLLVLVVPGHMLNYKSRKSISRNA